MASPKSLNSFLGQGWSFPPVVNGAGGMAMTVGEKDIEASIRVILATAKGERVMRPEFGSIIQGFVFSPNNATTHGLLSYHVSDALRQWEPRIDLISVDAMADPSEPAQVRIEISYKVKQTNDERNLVYPFYLIPREE